MRHFLLLAVISVSTCKARSKSDLAQNAGQKTVVDARIINAHHRSGTALTEGLKWMTEEISKPPRREGGRVIPAIRRSDDLRYLADLMRREGDFATTTIDMIAKFKTKRFSIKERREVNTQSLEQALLAADSIKTYTQNFLKKSDNLDWDVFAEFVLECKTGITELTALHNSLMTSMKSWVDAPLTPPVVINEGPGGGSVGGGQMAGGQMGGGGPVGGGQVAGGGQVGGGQPAGNGDENPFIVNGCPRRLRSGMPFEEKKQISALIFEMNERLVKMADGLPDAREVGGVIRDMNSRPLDRFNPGDCGPGKSLDRCYGKPLIDLLSRVPDIRCIYEGDVGVAEGYSLREHTMMVLQVYAAQRRTLGFGDIQVGGFSLDSLMPVILAFHDIGKPVALAKGNKNLQHEYTMPILDNIMGKSGYNADQVQFAKSLIDHDIIGDALIAIQRGQDSTYALTRAAKVLQGVAGKLNGIVDLNQYMFSQAQYYISDAASYPGLWSQSRVFAFGSSGNPNCPSSRQICTQSGNLERLSRMVRGEEPMGGGNGNGGNPNGSGMPIPPKPPVAPGGGPNGGGNGGANLVEGEIVEGPDLGGLTLDRGGDDTPYSVIIPGAK